MRSFIPTSPTSRCLGFSRSWWPPFGLQDARTLAHRIESAPQSCDGIMESGNLMPAAAAISVLTTTKAPFIEEAQSHGQLFIHQPYELYSEENHDAWRRLYARMMPRWERYANDHFLHGVESLRLPPDRVPRLDEVNGFL